MALTHEDRIKGGITSAEKRRSEIVRRAARAQVVDRVVSETEDLAPSALRAALSLIEKAEAAAEGMDVENPLDLQRVANAAEIIHRISRLAGGQSTSNVAHANLSDDDRRELMARLRAQAAQAVDGDAAPGQ